MADVERCQQRAFEDVFARFDSRGTGSINTKDFLHLIDELDAMQPETADPIISDEQRESATAVVEAAIAMSRSELLEFLEELGVSIHFPVERDFSTLKNDFNPGPEEGLVAQTNTTVQFEASGRSQFQVIENRPSDESHRNKQLDRLALSQADDVDDYNENDSPLRRSHSPIAQSTPNKDSPYARTVFGKENRRPVLHPNKSGARSQSYLASSTSSSSSPIYRPGTQSQPDWLQIDHTPELQNQIKLLQDREKASERTISSNEQRIHQLEFLIEESRQELQKSDRITSELRASYTAAEATIHLLERDVVNAHQELSICQSKVERLRCELDSQNNENDRLQQLTIEQGHEIDKSRIQLQIVSADHKLAQQEQSKLVEQICTLDMQSDHFATLEEELVQAQKNASAKDQLILELTSDIEEIKKASRRRPTLKSLDSVDGKHRLELNDKETQTTQLQKNDDGRTESIEGLTNAPPSVKEDTMKQHYANLSTELGLQRDLIDKMMSMKAGIKQQKLKGRSVIRSASMPMSGQEKSQATKFLPLSRSYWLTAWPLLLLYSLVFLGLGYILASQSSAVNAPGVSYAELKSWERANAIDYVLEYHGIMGQSSSYRWWEGGWLWVEMAGYWLEEKLIDHPWPS